MPAVSMLYAARANQDWHKRFYSQFYAHAPSFLQVPTRILPMLRQDSWLTNDHVVPQEQSSDEASLSSPEPRKFEGAAEPPAGFAVDEPYIRYSLRTTLFERLSENGTNFCRYCGTTEGISWRPGPWGKGTLCNKHGCDYRGYGFASKEPRLDLSAYENESIADRIRPVVQEFCFTCNGKDATYDRPLVMCDGCQHSYHPICKSDLPKLPSSASEPWYCSAACKLPANQKKIVCNAARKSLPLMAAPTKPPSKAAYSRPTPLAHVRAPRQPKALAKPDVGQPARVGKITGFSRKPTAYRTSALAAARRKQKRRESDAFDIGNVVSCYQTAFQPTSFKALHVHTPSWRIIEELDASKELIRDEPMTSEDYLKIHDKYEQLERASHVVLHSRRGSSASSDFQSESASMK